MEWLLFAAIGRLADILSTVYALRKGFKEGHPVTAWTMRKFGSAWWAVNLVLSAAIVAGVGYMTGDTTGVAIGLGAISFAVAARNIWIVSKA